MTDTVKEFWAARRTSSAKANALALRKMSLAELRTGKTVEELIAEQRELKRRAMRRFGRDAA